MRDTRILPQSKRKHYQSSSEGHDLLASAQTGTGKTAAFAIPIIQLINNNKQEGYENRKIKALVLSPNPRISGTNQGKFQNLCRKIKH